MSRCRFLFCSLHVITVHNKRRRAAAPGQAAGYSLQFSFPVCQINIFGERAPRSGATTGDRGCLLSLHIRGSCRSPPVKHTLRHGAHNSAKQHLHTLPKRLRGAEVFLSRRLLRQKIGLLHPTGGFDHALEVKCFIVEGFRVKAAPPSGYILHCCVVLPMFPSGFHRFPLLSLALNYTDRLTDPWSTCLGSWIVHTGLP